MTLTGYHENKLKKQPADTKINLQPCNDFEMDYPIISFGLVHLLLTGM